jgi:hypothetical protein
MPIKPTHRERKPARRCKCGTWLSSANEDPWCWSCGGWTTLRLSALGALAEIKLNHPSRREEAGELLEELMSA